MIGTIHAQEPCIGTAKRISAPPTTAGVVVPLKPVGSDGCGDCLRLRQHHQGDARQTCEPRANKKRPIATMTAPCSNASAASLKLAAIGRPSHKTAMAQMSAE